MKIYVLWAHLYYASPFLQSTPDLLNSTIAYIRTPTADMTSMNSMNKSIASVGQISYESGVWQQQSRINIWVIYLSLGQCDSKECCNPCDVKTVIYIYDFKQFT